MKSKVVLYFHPMLNIYTFDTSGTVRGICGQFVKNVTGKLPSKLMVTISRKRFAKSARFEVNRKEGEPWTVGREATESGSLQTNTLYAGMQAHLDCIGIRGVGYFMIGEPDDMPKFPTSHPLVTVGFQPDPPKR